MQKEELLLLVKKIQNYQCELQEVEVKSAQKGTPTRLYDTLSSFSNQDGGGIIVFGLDECNSFAATGVYDAQDLQHKVAEQCKQMEPAVRPLFSIADIDEKMIVSAEIPGVDIADRPVYYKGAGRVRGSYIRVGEADEPMSDYEIYSYDAYHRRVRDDIRVAELADISMLDEVLLDRYLLSVKENKANLAKLPNDSILNLMGITKNGKPTLAGVMCFSKYPQATFPQLCITAVVVPGTQIGETGSEGERFLSNKRIEGTIADMLEAAVIFVNRNMHEKTIIDHTGKRIDKPEYPPKAVREAILNALMHRDYSIHTEGTPIRLVMYRDRLEITNDGGLYGRLTLDSLGKIHADTRNPTLTHLLEVQKTAENRYSGVPTIRYEMNAAGLPAPHFESRRGGFVVTLQNESAHSTQITATTTAITPYADGGEQSILDFCSVPRTRAELSAFLNKTQYYAMRKIISPLICEGKLELTIPDKPKSKSQRYCTKKV